MQKRADFEPIEGRNNSPAPRFKPSQMKTLSTVSAPARASSLTRRSRKSSRMGSFTSKRRKASLLMSVKAENPRQEITYLDLEWVVPLTDQLPQQNTPDYSGFINVSTALLGQQSPVPQAANAYAFIVPISFRVKLAAMSAPALESPYCCLWQDYLYQNSTLPGGTIQERSYDQSKCYAQRDLVIKVKEFGASSKYALGQPLGNYDWGCIHWSFGLAIPAANVLTQIGLIRIRFKSYVFGRAL